MDTSFWDKAFPTIVGALIGGLAAIAALAVREWFDRRRAVQSWYEEVFIFEGVSQLIIYLSAVDDLLTTLQFGDVVPSDLFEAYPRAAVERFRKLFPNCAAAIVTLEIVRANCAKTQSNQDANQDGVQQALNMVTKVKQNLIALEKELLGLNITRKRDVYQIRDNERVRPLLAKLEQIERPSSTTERKDIALPSRGVTA